MTPEEVTRQVSEACGCGSVDCPERIKVVAAALAACAREEALEWDKTAQLHITRWTELEWRNERLRALERAVGEKGRA